MEKKPEIIEDDVRDYQEIKEDLKKQLEEVNQWIQDAKANRNRKRAKNGIA